MAVRVAALTPIPGYNPRSVGPDGGPDGGSAGVPDSRPDVGKTDKMKVVLLVRAGRVGWGRGGGVDCTG